MARLEGQTLDGIAGYHNDAVAGFGLFFQNLIDRNDTRVIGYSLAEVGSFQSDRNQETEIRSSLAVLAAVEAAFRIDYLVRAKRRGKDNLSRDFKKLYQQFASRVSFEEDLLDRWASHHSNFRSSISELKGALRFRHWIAHGRYWEPRLGRKYDYAYTYQLAVAILSAFPLLSDD